jgi:hypothetical protein
MPKFAIATTIAIVVTSLTFTKYLKLSTATNSLCFCHSNCCSLTMGEEEKMTKELSIINLPINVKKVMSAFTLIIIIEVSCFNLGVWGLKHFERFP